MKSTFAGVTFEGKIRPFTKDVITIPLQREKRSQCYLKIKRLLRRPVVAGLLAMTIKEVMLKINEIYHSIQGESTTAGRLCVFVRLTYCNLRCTYCDTEYAFYDGKDMSIQQVIDEVEKYNCKLVEVTGGEPLVQMEECLELMKRLCDLSYDVMIETGGSLPIKDIDQRVKIIMDLKCPSSAMERKNLYDNIKDLKPTDELKFVIGNFEDFDWSVDVLKKYNLKGKCEILFSVVFGKLEPVELVNWILEDKLDVRFQLQMHKYIWHPEIKGV